MNTPCPEAGGWTALVGGNPTERIGRSRVNDMAGNDVGKANGARGKRGDIDNAKRWAQPESREDRVNHFARGLDAIRDSRIAFQDGFRDAP